MAKRKIEQAEQEIRKLRLAADNTKDAKEMKRLQAVRLYYDGRAVSDIVQIVECGERSLFRWVADYQREGIAGLKSKYKGGNSAKLSREQKNEIREKLHTYRPSQVLSPEVRISQGDYWMVSDLRIAVQEWYGVTYQTATSYRTLLKECGFSLQRAERRYRSRASEAEIADFEAEVEKK